MIVIYNGQMLATPSAKQGTYLSLIAQMRHACQKFEQDGRPASGSRA